MLKALQLNYIKKLREIRMKSKRKDTTIAINAERREMLEKALIKVIIDTHQQLKMSELVHHLIDEYLEDGVNDIIQDRKKAKRV